MMKDEARAQTGQESNDLRQVIAELQFVRSASDRVLAEVERAVVGKRRTLELVLTGILAGGHVLFEDVPGLAKTLLATSFSRSLGVEFRRIQFTPDMLPSDIIGTYVFHEKDREFVFRKGPVFTNVLLADEINRAPPKTQSALLEAMHERQVTVEGTTHPLPAPFVVLATQNPIEYEGTYPLPEAQLDRFALRLSMGYPSRDSEDEILSRRLERKKESHDLKRVLSAAEVVRMQHLTEEIKVSRPVRTYCLELVSQTRNHPDILVGASPRGTQMLMRCSQALAALRGRFYCLVDDVKAVAVHVLGHRLVLQPSARFKKLKGDTVIQKLLASVPVPK